MNHGTYVSGYRFDWEQAHRDTDSYFASGRPEMAAACADPGCCSCPQCGEQHMREFEVFLCGRCGAEITLLAGGSETAGPPKYPQMCRPRLRDGMRVRYVGQTGTDIKGRPKQFPGLWPAGRIEPGECGTVRQEDGDHWRIDFDDRIPRCDKEDGQPCVWGIFGPFVDDTLEVLPDLPEGVAT